MESHQEPAPMSRGQAIAYAIGLPIGLLALIFLPAGSIDAGRFHCSALPLWTVIFGYLTALLLFFGQRSRL